MVKPARKLATQNFREVFGAAQVDFSADVEETLSALGLDLNDLDSALLSSKVYLNNTVGTNDDPEVVMGTTTEGITLELAVWIESDIGIFVVESVSLVPIAIGDAESEHEQEADNGKSANDK